MMKTIKYFFAAVGVGAIAYFLRDTLIAGAHILPTLAQLSVGQWMMVAFILFNVWLWKYHHKHPALEVLWTNFSYVYKVILMAFAIKYVSDKWFNKDNK